MATYYWVGGAGTWNNTLTTNWRTTSGGTTVAPNAPLSTDTVVFDVNSGIGSVVVASTSTCSICNFGAADITATLNANNITGWATATLNISAGVFSTSTFTSTISTVNVTGGTFIHVSGTKSNSVIGSSGLAARTISLGSATITANSTIPINLAGTGLTFNAGTSTIICSNLSPTIYGNGNTFYNVSFSSSSQVTTTINGANTFNNLTFAGKSVAGIVNVVLSANQTINGTLTVTAPTTLGSTRYFFRSSLLGVIRTLTGNTANLTDVDFRDINHVGTTWVGTRLGDCGGNSGITFDAPKIVYWEQSTGNWNTNSSWALAPGGAKNNINFPLPQDIARFTDNVGFGNGSTCTINFAYNIGSIDCSARTINMNLAAGSFALSIYGDIILRPSVTITGTGILSLSGRNITQNIESAGQTFTRAITQLAKLGTVNLVDPLIITGTYTLSDGNLTTNSNITCLAFVSIGTTTRSISLGSGQMYCTGAGIVFNVSSSGGLTVFETPTINVTSTGSTAITITPGSTTGVSNLFNFNFTGGTYGLTITSDNIVNNLNFTGYSGILANTTFDVYGNLNFGSTIVTSTGIAITRLKGSGTKTISGTANYNYPILIDGAGTWVLQNNTGILSVNNPFTLTNGTIDLNGFNLTVNNFTTGIGTKNITFNGGILYINSGGTSFFNANPTGFTTSKGGINYGAISLTSSTTKTFAGGNSIYNCYLQHAGSGTLTISGANTFVDMYVAPVLQGTATTITFPSILTTTFLDGFSLNGTSTGLVTITSSIVRIQANLSLASGTINASYLSITDINVGGGATWKALTTNGNIYNGNNTGWMFSNPTPISSGNFMLMFI